MCKAKSRKELLGEELLHLKPPLSVHSILLYHSAFVCEYICIYIQRFTHTYLYIHMHGQDFS